MSKMPVSSSASLILMRRWLACCTEEAGEEREWKWKIRKTEIKTRNDRWVTAFATWTLVLLLVYRQHDRMTSGVLVCVCVLVLFCVASSLYFLSSYILIKRLNAEKYTRIFGLEHSNNPLSTELPLELQNKPVIAENCRGHKKCRNWN